jgi:hypothetical protein
VRVTGIRAQPVRGARRARGATRITFTLSARALVVFVVRGPAPSCDVAGRFRVRGKRGVNHLRFTGRIGRRRLAAGTYRVVARPRGRLPSRPVTVVLGGGPRDAFACRSAVPAGPFETVLASLSGSSSGQPPASTRERREQKRSGVLPAVTDKLKALPRAVPTLPDGASAPHRLVGLGALLLLALSLLALVVYVVRFVRGPHPS